MKYPIPVLILSTIYSLEKGKIEAPNYKNSLPVTSHFLSLELVYTDPSSTAYSLASLSVLIYQCFKTVFTNRFTTSKINTRSFSLHSLNRKVLTVLIGSVSQPSTFRIK